MNRRTFVGALAAAGTLGTTAGCLGSHPLRSHPLPPVRGRVVRTSVVGVREGEADVILVVTPDAVDPGPEMADARAAVGDAGDGASAPWFTVPPTLHTALLERFDELRYYVTVNHQTRIRVYGIESGDWLRYRTRLEVFRRVVPSDRILFTIRPAGSPYFQNTNAILREGTVRRKRLRVGSAGDLRTVLTVTPDGVSRGDGPDLSLPVAEERLDRLRDRFSTVRLAVTVEHALGDRAFTQSYYADRRPFNRLTPGRTTRFGVETMSSDDATAAGQITTLDPDSPFYDGQPW